MLAIPLLAREVGRVQLAFHDGMGPIKAGQLHGNVKLLIGEQDSGINIDIKEGLFTAPYGDYTLVVVAEGFRTYRRPILVCSKRADILVALQVGEIADYEKSPPPPQIEGRIVSESHDLSSLWVRILPIFGREGVTFDSLVDSNGRFSVVLSKGTERCVVLVLAPGVGEYGEARLNAIWVQEVEATEYLRIRLE
ncbi:MAG: hypothetical protein H6509_14205 [Bryobacterales bacterium]|nr:hypothetical protein [Bryobacterales bacterium]